MLGLLSLKLKHFFHCSPLSSHRQRIFMVMTMPELCKWMSRAVQAKSENAEKQSKKDKNVASSAAFFPSSGIHWGLAVHFIFFFFFTEALSCSPGNNKAVHYLSQWALNGEAADWASELSKCSGQLHTHSFILKHCIKHMNKVSVTDLWTQRSSFSWE